MDKFWIRLLKMSEKIPMFPHPQDLLGSACKVQRDNDLMRVAISETLTPFPRSLTLVGLEELLKQAQNPSVVIKRDYSDSSEWTFLPGRRRVMELEAKFQETTESYREIKTLPYPAWIAQPFMPSLLEKGELRAYVVGGKLMYTIHTWVQKPGGEIHMEVVENFTPLEFLS